MSDRILPVLLLAALFAGAMALMYLGWRSRGRSQADVPAPPPDAPLEQLGETLAEGPFEAVYVSTVRAGDPLDRIVAHGLGSRSRARISVGSAGTWRIDREGARSFTLPADTVTGLFTTPGIAGKAVGGDGLLLIRWQLSEDAPALDTGLRMDRRADHDLLLTRKELA
ncbi:hypothetical protein [Brachybacterium sp. Marseille-Q7125]|uniref:PH-like domain-containing protein n=1 Tax=Brachybacterium sp. Marseille-Q7125 TaxID=2932815 RepID=UPI001FF1210E